MRAVYFTIVPLFDESNGGNICCRNHVRRIAADPSIELSVVAAGLAAWEAGTKRFLEECAVPGTFVTLSTDNVRPEGHSLRDIARFASTMVLQSPWDAPALNQQHVAQTVDNVVASFAASWLIVDYLPSALYVKPDRSRVRTALVKLNREGDFYRDLLVTRNQYGRWRRAASLARWRRKERTIESSFDKVIAIGPPDLPRHLPEARTAVATPWLDRPRTWRWTGSRRVCFVGNVNHFPNRSAVDWIATRLAPEVERLDASVSFDIVGTDASEALPSWQRPNVRFLGHGDSTTVARLYAECDMAVCPVSNDYGCKFKAAEALAFGTPLLASRQTLLGLPYLPPTPALDLADPIASARSVVEPLADRELLLALQRDQAARHLDFVASQQGFWSRVLEGRGQDAN